MPEIEYEAVKDSRWEILVQPKLDHFFETRRGKEFFEAVQLEYTDEALDAVLKDAELSCAFLNDYGDHCEGLSVPVETDIIRCWDRAVQKVVKYIIEYNNPYYDPVMKAFCASFTDEEVRQLVQQMSSSAGNSC